MANKACKTEHVPNAKTRAAMREARRGGLPRFKDIPSLLAELNADDSDDVDALLKHVHQIGKVPGPHEVVFLADGAMPYVADWDWLRVALHEVLGVKLPASVRKAVEAILAAPCSRRKLPPLPVVVRSGGRFSVHAIDLVRSCPPPRLGVDRAPRRPARSSRRVAGDKLTVEFDRETDGRWIAEVPELPGVLVYGGTQDEALAKVLSLARSVLADKVEHGERDQPGANSKCDVRIRNSSRSRSKGR
ncbi:MAG: type II toxin-antitoxin system HicB family antitoxin [Polyangiaceae bacterium]